MSLALPRAGLIAPFHLVPLIGFHANPRQQGAIDRAVGQVDRLSGKGATPAGARYIIEGIQGRSLHPHESELKRRTESRPGAKPAAQYMPIIARQREKPPHFENAHLPRKTATPNI
jgi:hypothetical protein